MNSGWKYPIGAETLEPIQLFPEGELMLSQLYYDKDKTQIIPTKKKRVKKTIEFYLQNLSDADYTIRLKGCAVPVERKITWQELIAKRIKTENNKAAPRE